MKKKISIVLALALALATEVAKADFIFSKLPNVGAPNESVQIRANVLVSPQEGDYTFLPSRAIMQLRAVVSQLAATSFRERPRS